MIQLREYQHQLISGIRKEIADGKNRILTVSPTGTGKCFAHGTKILMYDGSVKEVQDILPGEKLKGWDSEERIVTSICSGKETMYKITPTKGDPYIVNESHILSLKITGTKDNIHTKNGVYKKGDIANISVKDYLETSKTFKHCAKGWRVGVDFEEKELPKYLPPYLLGTWLGDGDRNQTTISLPDKEVSDYFYEFCNENNMKIRKDYGNTGCPNFHFTKAKGVYRNPIKEQLKKYNLLNNKHIPDDYKINSIDNRLELLAGLIDTDGFYGDGVYEIITKFDKLKEDILYLARSLGFAAYSSIKKVKYNGELRDYHRIVISGDLVNIPCKIERKKPKERKQKKSVLMTGIKVEKLEEDFYYGFEISGRDRMFLLSDFTVVHNTVLFTYIAKNAEAKGNRVLILTHRMEILQQTLSKLFQFGVQSGQIISGGRITKDIVQVAMVQTAVNRLDKMQKPDIIIVDEAHHSVSDTFKKIINYWNDTTIIGFTATPERLSGEGLNDIYQVMLVGYQTNWHVENGFLAYPRVFHPAIEHKFKFHTKQGDYDKKEMQQAYSQKVIIGDVIAHYRKYLDRKPVVCFCVSIEHCEIMSNEFRQAGYVAAVVKGDMKKEDRDAAINGLSTGAVHIVCSCDVISEGVDVPTLAGVILLRKTQSLGLYLQWIGRALRPAEGKDHAIILDHAGNWSIHGHPLLEREWSLEAKKRSMRKNEKSIEVTSCPKCYGVFPGKPRICPECGFQFSENKNISAQQRKTPKQIEGELTEALYGVQNANDLVNFGKQIQSLDPKIRQKALLRKAYELSSIGDKESFKKVMQPLAASVGYKKNWTDYVWKNILKKA